MKRELRQKMHGAPHLVPLPKQAVAVLRELHVLTGHAKMVFRGERHHDRAMSENTINAALRAMGARHLRTRPYTPRTNGKAERFIQTCLREWAYRRPYRSSAVRAAALPGFIQRYNVERPHTSLQRRPPLARLLALGEQRA